MIYAFDDGITPSYMLRRICLTYIWYRNLNFGNKCKHLPHLVLRAICVENLKIFISFLNPVLDILPKFTSVSSRMGIAEISQNNFFKI